MSNTRGIVMLAQNTLDEDYVKQAYLCALSILATNPGTKISLITDDNVDHVYKKAFDKIIGIPWGDAAVYPDWKVENRWKIYHVSPYDETIVLDTDMLVLQNISGWWEYLKNYEVFFTSNVLTYRGKLVTDDFYRKTFTENNLPNLYSGFHYFKKTKFSHEFFSYLQVVVENWEKFYDLYLEYRKPPRVSIDVAAAIVCKMLNCEEKITSKNNHITFTHMKPRCQDWTRLSPRWQDRVNVYLRDDLILKIGNYRQTGIFHYTEKEFVTESKIDTYRRFLRV